MRIVERAFSEADRRALVNAGVHPVLARVYAARRIRSAAELDDDVRRLLPPASLARCEEAAALLADAIAAGRRLLIIADYDADGATACAVGMRALSAMGARVDYLVPNRFELGYGLTPELADIAAQGKPDLLITVDNGIASAEGVERARALGIDTLITDHHLPGPELPRAACIVNPNQPGCTFASKSLAGVGVMFYVMLALRAELRRRGAFRSAPEPNLAALTDLVALGTVADVVPLDANNRILVAQGLKRIRAGRSQPGIDALLRAAGRAPAEARGFDLGFVLGPRLNAAGRLADMSLGIACLVTDDAGAAANGALELDRLNRERRRIEAGMLREAQAAADAIADAPGAAAAFYEPSWHQGVVGILAARLRERLHRPVFCFAPAGDGERSDELRGSGRSIPGFHLRDCLDLVAKRAPGLILRFGGHAQAAGLTLRASDLERFRELLAEVAASTMPREALTRTVETDGNLSAAELSLGLAQLLEAGVWGPGFPAPLFCDTFALESQRVVGEKHSRLKLVMDGRRLEAMRFNALDPLPARFRAAYRLSVNDYDGMPSVQVSLEHVEAP
jgi:single-stranded-DNA-specific exonuclease